MTGERNGAAHPSPETPASRASSSWAAELAVRAPSHPPWSGSVKISGGTEPGPTAAQRLNETKPKVSAHIAKVADGGTLQFWGIALRDLGNVPKSPLEHPR